MSESIRPEDITGDMVTAVEQAVSMGSGAWDMCDPKEIIAAAVNASDLGSEVARLTRDKLRLLEALDTLLSVLACHGNICDWENVDMFGIDVATKLPRAIENGREAIRSLVTGGKP